ncbi:MAG TPA: hypothetical protein VF081_04460 [Solirubrobacterales bacterium]
MVDPAELAESWVYLAVDEIVGDRVGLSVARWPGVDDHGRLRFADSSEDELLGASLENFREFVRLHRFVMVMAPSGELDPGAADALSERNLRIGDVFAIPRSVINDSTSGADSGVHEFEAPDGTPIYDISFEAREQAKLAGAAAVAPPLDHEEARRFLGDEGADGDTTHEDGPGDDGPGGSQPPEEPKPVGAGPGGVVVPAEQVAELTV